MSGAGLDGILGAMDKRLPVVLFPVRVETRFEALTNGNHQLKVRIYPDDLHVDTHEPELSADEEQWGQFFWVQYWLAGNDPDLEGAAWAQLVGRFGGPRAAWIAHSLTPTNPGDKPSSPPPSGQLTVPPSYPSVTQRPGKWTRAAIARLLPDYWVAWGWRDGVLEFAEESSSVQRDLAVGPDPNTLGASGTVLDQDIQWMVDFAKAKQVGMALEAELEGEARLDQLVVFGLRSALAPIQKDELEEQLRVLRYSTGLDFAPQGVATNSTDASRSGWSTGEDDETSVEAAHRWLGQVPLPVGEINAAVMSRVLYVDYEVLARCRHAADTEQRDARMMNQLLWPVTGGYFLWEMLGWKSSPNTQALDRCREHFVDWVRGRGPIPALRAGNQPYGVLPILVGQIYDPIAGAVEDYINVMVQNARTTWNASAPDVHRLNPGSPDADADLVRALATLPNPERFSVRVTVDRDTITDFAATLPLGWLGDTFDFWGPRAWLDQITEFDTSAYPLHDIVHSGGVREWVGPLITSEPLSDFDPLSSNYLSWLATAPIGDVTGDLWSGENDSLLYVLARRARLLWETTALSGGGDADLIQDALAHLADLPTSALEVLLRETLATVGYRLDAWEMSLVTRQLEVFHQEFDGNPLIFGGVYLGCYGWVEDLVADQESGAYEGLGFVHAPTQQHGVTAALLRSTWASHGGGANTPFAVDISSARARDALELLDGVRSGFTLGELLGYRFERQLHEGYLDTPLELDQYIVEFRAIAPLVVGKQPGTEPDPGVPVEQAGASSVVDGLKLAGMWQTGDPVLGTVLAGLPTGARNAVQAELDALGGAIDAMADIGMAEAVHQIAQGNTERAAAITDALSTGSTPPPESDVVRPPRSSLGIAHRVFIPFDDDNPIDDPWPGTGVKPRALVEPQVERSLTILFPAPASVEFRVEFAPEGAPVVESFYSLADLGLSALDAMLLAPPEGALTGEFERRVAWTVERALPVGVVLGTPYTVDPDSVETVGATSLADFALLARALRKVLSEARPMNATDVARPTDFEGRGIDLPALRTRSHQLAGWIRTARTDLDGVDPEVDLEAVRTALIAASDLGIPGAFPVDAAGSDDAARQALAAQLDAVRTRMQGVVDALGEDADVDAELAAADANTAEALLVGRMRLGFGRAMPILPRFTVGEPVKLAMIFSNTEALQGGEPRAAASWLHTVAQVRGSVRDVLTATQLSESLADTARLTVKVGQRPYVPGETWVGLPFDPNNRPTTGKVSLVSIAAGPLQWNGPLHGLLLDEWLESVPRLRETTGLVFNHDAPASKPPQAILVLGVTNQESGWTSLLVQDAMRDTLDSARRRLADITALGEGGHFIPAVYLETGSATDSDIERGLVDEGAEVSEPDNHNIDGP